MTRGESGNDTIKASLGKSGGEWYCWNLYEEFTGNSLRSRLMGGENEILAGGRKK
jgi:hypothetical protein